MHLTCRCHLGKTSIVKVQLNGELARQGVPVAQIAQERDLEAFNVHLAAWADMVVSTTD